MIIYFDTVKRKRPVNEAGELVKLDWTTKKIEKIVPMFPQNPEVEHDSNPRGNSRGGKGILLSDDNEIFAATYHSIHVFDLDLNLKRIITNNLFVNIHEMCWDGEYIWVSSTAIDCAVKVDKEGNTLKTWWPREEIRLQERFGLERMDIDKGADNRLKYIHAEISTKQHHTHLNSVIKSIGNGNTYAFLNKQGVLVQMEPETAIIIQDENLRGGHSPAVTFDGKHVIICSSMNKDILVYNLENGNLEQKIHLPDFKEIGELQKQFPDQPFNRTIFVRGLEIIDSGRILTGISPASILEIDLNSGHLTDFYRFSDDIGDAVHGLVHLNETGFSPNP